MAPSVRTKDTGSCMRDLEAAARWGKKVLSLDWLASFCQQTPTLIKVVEHGNSQLPTRVTDEPLLLHSVVSHRKVIAHSVNTATASEGAFTSKTRGVATPASVREQRFSIPLAYDGWFEILNEDGQAAVPLSRVSQLVEAMPPAFLVRDKTKVYYCGSATTAVAGKELTADKSRAVLSGEVMAVVGIVTAMLGWRRRRKLALRCLDESGTEVYFDTDVRSSFSPISTGTDDIGGVHRISAVAEAFRMPLTVRLVSGRVPGAASAGAAFRLSEVREDDVALLLPLHSSQKVMPVSLRTKVEVAAAENRAELLERADFRRLLELCSQKADRYAKTIQVLVSTDRQGVSCSVGSSTSLASAEVPIPRSTLPTTPEENLSHPCWTLKVPETDQSSEEDMLFDEVDDLYDYVRRGGEPPKPRPRSWTTHSISSSAAAAATTGSPRTLDDGRSVSQPILSSNGVMRGRLAELTNGRFPSSGSRSSLPTATASGDQSRGSRSVSMSSVTPSSTAAQGATGETSASSQGQGHCVTAAQVSQVESSVASEKVANDTLSSQGHDLNHSVWMEHAILTNASHLSMAVNRSQVYERSSCCAGSQEPVTSDSSKPSSVHSANISAIAGNRGPSPGEDSGSTSWQRKCSLPHDEHWSLSSHFASSAANACSHVTDNTHDIAVKKSSKTGCSLSLVTNRSTGNLVKLFEELTVAKGDSRASCCYSLAAGSRIRRRGSQPAAGPNMSLFEERLGGRAVSDTIKKRITTLQTSARPILV